MYRQLAPGNPLGLLVGGLPEFAVYARDWYGVDVAEIDRQQLADAFVADNLARADSEAAAAACAATLPPQQVGIWGHVLFHMCVCLCYSLPDSFFFFFFFFRVTRCGYV